MAQESATAERTGAAAGDRPATVGAAPLSIQEARAIIADLFAPNMAIYWTDFLASAAVGYGCALVYLTAPAFSLAGILSFVVAGLALFRAGAFIHEIVHMPKGRAEAFKTVWNLLYGVPMLMPSFMYKNHADHHNWRHYGTPKDGEYLPLASVSVRHLFLYLAQAPILPLLAVFRFLVLAPLALLRPKLRRKVWERFSSYVSNPHYRRSLPANEKRGGWVALEIGCFAGLAGMLTLLIAGIVPWVTLVELYLLGVYTVGLNWLRNLAGHTFRNTGAPMTHVEQLADSINITGHPLLTELLFPVGLRWHALHHLFPSMPYHALGKAHRRLMRELPSDSAYRLTVYPNFRSVLRQLWRNARAAGSTPMPDWVAV